MTKYIIILLSMLLLAGSMTNAQTIKRNQKPKTEQTQKNNNSNKSSKVPSKSSKADSQKSNSSTSSKKSKSKKADTSSSDRGSVPSRSNPASSYSQSSVPTTRSTEPKTYNVKFSCNVSNAYLLVDGKHLGIANGNYSLSTGTHSVVVKCPGYVDNTALINITSAASYHYDLAQAIDITRINENMVLIRGGSFKMGATKEQGKGTGKNERPTHKVTISDFYICKYEVTQELWLAVMGTNPSFFKGEARHSVECVSWEECQEFLYKLNRLTGKHYRLPTEAEWEYAARGGSGSNGYKYAGDKELDNVGWYDRNSSSMTHPVGTKLPNELGLYDMSGNVAEWCQDWYSAYSNSSETNPTGPSSGSGRIFRGGCWSDNATYCRVANRLDNAPSYSYYGIGLRLAASFP